MVYDVLIAGGGITGCAVARELSRYQLQVALCEKEAEVSFGTTKANSGIVHGGHHTDPGTLKGWLEWKGNPLWDTWHAELGFGFVRCGELTVALAPDQLPELDMLMHQAQVKGVPGVELWERERVLAEEPALSPQVIAAVYAPTTAVVNPYEACFALAASAVRNGVQLLLDSPVLALAPVDEDPPVWAITTPDRVLYSRFVVNAAGLYADEVARMADDSSFTIRPRKGEEYLLDKRLQGLVRRVIFPCPTPVSKGILVIPTCDGTIMVGPTATSAADREDLTTTAEGAEQIFAAAAQLVPGISSRDVIAQFAGLRAAADGEDFIIEPSRRRGLIHAAGIQSPGLTSAPAIARMVAEILRDEGLALTPRDDFVAHLPSIPRFAMLSTAEQMALAADDPAYRHIVCRCELVTEGEVLEAITQGASTLDGVKLRTRAGMGRCQGGFCTTRCLSLLARAAGVPISAITKRGPGSWLVLDRPPAPDSADVRVPAGAVKEVVR